MLTDRQSKILKAVIEEYISTADPVASELLEKKYSLGVSPATIRNEMVDLTEQGFLKQPHTSSGRIPTPQGLKFYIDHLMQQKDLSVLDEVSAKEKIWDSRHNLDRLLRQAASTLAERTKTLAIAITDEGDLYYAGTANILDMPEFYDIDVTRNVLGLLDQYGPLQELFFKRVYGEDPVHIVMGADLNWPYLDPVGFVFSHFKTQNHTGTVGIIGPCRLNYPYVIPTVKYFGDLISELGRSW
jgi:heat-inducible transcriptional repressor